MAEQCSSSKEEIYGIKFWCHDPSNHAWHPIDYVTPRFHHWLQPIEWHPEWETNQIFEYMISVIMRETPVIMSHSDFHQVARSSLRPVSVSCDRWPLPGKGCTEWFSFNQKKFAGRNHQCTLVAYLPQNQYIWQTSGCVVKPYPVLLMTRTDNGWSISNEVEYAFP